MVFHGGDFLKLKLIFLFNWYLYLVVSLGGIFPYQSVSLQKLSIPHKYFGQADPQTYAIPKEGQDEGVNN